MFQELLPGCRHFVWFRMVASARGRQKEPVPIPTVDAVLFVKLLQPLLQDDNLVLQLEQNAVLEFSEPSVYRRDGQPGLQPTRQSRRQEFIAT